MLTHRYWYGPNRPLPIDACHQWDDDQLPTDVVEWLDAKADLVTDKSRRVYHRSNMVRWWILANHGGIYADYDTPVAMLLNLPPAPFTATHGNIRCVRLMAFPANHPIPVAAVEWLQADPPRDHSAVAVSGDMLLNSLTRDCESDIARVPLG